MKITKSERAKLIGQLVEAFTSELEEKHQITNDNINLGDYLETITPDPSLIKVPYSIINVINDRKINEFIKLVHNPMIVSQFYKLDELELKYSINEAVKAFTQLLKNTNPKHYYYLPLPVGVQSVHCIINNFPVRAVLAYNEMYGCYVLTLDTLGNNQLIKGNQ